MADEPDSSPRQRFVRDLRRIREEREVTRAEILEVTQIVESQLAAFEEGTLFDQPSMNRVYLRAFVRAYAEALGLDPDTVADQLEEALEGSYDNQLAVRYLDVPPSVVEEEPSPPETDVSEAESGSGASEPASTGEGEPEEGEQTRRAEESMIEEESVREEGPLSDASDSEEEEHPTPSWLEGDSEERSEEGTVDPSSTQSAPASKGRSESTQRQPTPPSRRSNWIPAGIWSGNRRKVLIVGISIVVLLGVLGILAVSYFGGASPSQDSSVQADPSAKTEAAASARPSDTTNSTSEPESPASLTLGDTLHVTVLATSAVRELRVQQDEDLRRPYWIEEGNATVFPFTQRITLENQLDSLRLFLDRYSYPTSRTDSLGRIVIDRQTAKRFVDTLRGSPTSLSVQPDTVEIRQPPSDAEGI